MFLRSLLFVFAATIAFAQQAPQPPAQLKTAPALLARTHQLPTGNTIQVDTEGRLRTHTTPGLAGKFVDYDADSRPVAVHLDYTFKGFID